MQAKQVLAAGQAMTSAQPLFLSIFRLWLLPLSVFVVTCSYFLKWLKSNWNYSSSNTRNATGKKRILVTGGTTSSTLGISRALHAAGHDVYVVDYERVPFTNPLRGSNAVTRFIGLTAGRLAPNITAMKTRFFHLGSLINISYDISQQQPLANLLGTILQLIESERIELWIPIEENGLQTVLQTKEVVTKHCLCQIYGPNVETTRISQDQDHFSLHVERLEHDIRFPSAIIVKSRAEIHRLLSSNLTGQKYILEPKDSPLKLPHLPTVPGKSERHLSSRVYDTSDDLAVSQRCTYLPLPSLNETYSTVAALTISRDQPWVMHQVIEGRPIRVSALVVNNSVSTFTASMSSRPMIYAPLKKKRNVKGSSFALNNTENWQRNNSIQTLDPNSALSQTLLDFTERFSHHLPRSSNLQLNLRFIIAETATSGSVVQTIWATGCDFEVSPLLVQRALTAGQLESVGAAYGCALNGGPLSLPAFSTTIGDRKAIAMYSLPAAAYQNLLLPIMNVVLLRTSPQAILIGLAVFLNLMAFGREELLDGNDSLPWIWRWCVQFPVEGSADFAEYAVNFLARYLKHGKHDEP